VLPTNLPANKLPLHRTTINLKKAGKVLGKKPASRPARTDTSR
jgi:hypothetical protein